jgi:hypothetical protein
MSNVDDFVAFVAEEIAREGPYGLVIIGPDPAKGECLWLAGPQTFEGAEGLVYSGSLAGVMNVLSQEWDFTHKDLNVQDDPTLSSVHRVVEVAPRRSVVLLPPSSTPQWGVRVEGANRTYRGLTLEFALIEAFDGLRKRK